MLLSAELARITFGVLVSTLISEALRSSGRVSDNNERISGMSYDLIGGGDDLLDALDVSGDDDDYGAIGADLLVGGDGSSEIIGGLIGAAKRGNPKAKKALRMIAMRHAGAVVNQPNSKRRRYPLGFVVTTIVASSSGTVPAAPQNLYRPERLVIPSDIAFDLGVSDLKVGNQSQFTASVEVPGALFSEVAIDTGVLFDTAEVGNQISIALRNKTAADVEFSAALVGAIAKS